ncbi:hypothetical protein C8R47DRAFT_1104527 [Mycena vitilis]|nr:hypothetical protein C8R47DRAFT_1104527 [Mycena vitilis]
MKYEEFSDRMPALTELTLDEALQHAARAASKLKRDLDQEKATSRDHFEKVTRQRQNLNGLQAKCNQAEARAKATSESGDILQKQMREVEEHLRRSEAALRTEQLERKAAEESRKIMEERYLATRQAFETAEHARKGAEEGRKTAEAATEVARDGRRKAEEGEKTAKQTLGSAERLAAGEKHLAERQAALNAEEHGMRAEREALAAELERAVEALLRRSKDSEPGTPRGKCAHAITVTLRCMECFSVPRPLFPTQLGRR